MTDTPAPASAFADRHARHLLVKEVGGRGVRALRAAHLHVVGAGALGGPAALYLAAAGAGRLTLWDDDRVEPSNLGRQVQFGAGDNGRLKTEALAERLRAQNPEVAVDVRARRFTATDAGALDGAAAVLAATDSFASRHGIMAAALEAELPVIHGAAASWRGEAAVWTAAPGAPCYGCWVPPGTPEGEDCNELGVVGPVAGGVALRMALEALKLAAGVARGRLEGRLWLWDALEGRERTVRVTRDPGCTLCSFSAASP